MMRARRDRLATALRQFGLVDSFDLAALLDGGAPPTEAAIKRRLARFPDGLPAGISPGYLARFIADELGRDMSVGVTGSPRLTANDAAALSNIPPGTRTAAQFHNQIFRILTGIFAERLVDPTKEAKQSSGRKRIDIRFRNTDETGFFSDLVRHGVHAPYVIVECKNYSSDPANPEFDQLSGRLDSVVGMIGIMVVRTITDRSHLDAHRLDRRKKSEWILVLDDQDVLTMLEAHLRGDSAAVDAVLRQRFEHLVFD